MSSDPTTTTWIQAICTTLGATLIGGPGGAAVGSAIGVALATVLPSPAAVSAQMAGDWAKDGLVRLGEAARQRIGPNTPTPLNHDLQEALRAAVRESLIDLGGEQCFAAAWAERPRLVAAYDIAYFHTPTGDTLRRTQPLLAEQACAALKRMVADLEADTLLPLLSAADSDPTRVTNLLLDDDASELARAFYDAVAAPYLQAFGAGLGLDATTVAESGFVAHVRGQLLPRTLLRLGELLKARPEVWRAYMRLVNQELAQTLRGLDAQQQANHRELLARLDALARQPEDSALVSDFLDQSRAMVSALGRVEWAQGQRFGELRALLGEQHREILASLQQTFDDLVGHMDQRFDRVDAHLEKLAPQGALRVGVPGLRRPLLGREELLDTLAARLAGGETLALWGPGGTGKSALAVALCSHPTVTAAFAGGVLWGGLGPEPDLDAVAIRWLEALGRKPTNYADVAARLAAVRDALGSRRTLIVLDDAWAADAVDALRVGDQPRLITTRRRDVARAVAGGESHTQEIPPLPDDAAETLLEEMASAAWAADADACRGLIAAVDNLPLGVELLGGYLAGPDFSGFAELAAEGLAELAEPNRRLALAQRRLEQQHGPKQTLQATVELSLSGLPPSSRDVFYALGAFAPQPADFDQEAARAVGGGTLRDLSHLINAALLVRRAESGRLALHQVTAAVATIATPQEAVMRHRQHYLALVNADRDDYRCIEAAYAQVRHAWERMEDDAVDDLDDYQAALADYQMRRGLWAEREDWLLHGLAQKRAQHDRPSEGKTLNYLGIIYLAQGRWDEAVDLYEQALAIHRELGDRPSEGKTLNNLGITYWYLAQGRWDEAVDLYEQALAIHNELGDRQNEARTLNNLGLVYAAQGRWDGAIKLYEEALARYRELGDRPGEGPTLNNLGEVYAAQGRWDEAMDLYEQALAIHRELGDRQNEARTLNNLGAVYAAQGRWDEAVDMYEQALAIHRELGDRQNEARTLNNLGAVYAAQGRWDEAMDLYEQALELGDRRRELGQTLNNLGEVYAAQGRWDEAMDLCEQALAIHRELGDRPSEGHILNDLGIVYQTQGRWAEAIKLYEDSLVIKRELGDRHGEGITLKNLGRLYKEQGQAARAVSYWREALTKLHPDSPEYGRVREWLEEAGDAADASAA